jgi:Putative addiction module component
MQTSFDDVKQRALELTEEQRADLAEVLLDSITPISPAVLAAWNADIQPSIDAMGVNSRPELCMR